MPVVERRKPIQVQLAKVYEGGNLRREWWAEPKMDGLRGVIILPTRASGIPGRALTRTGLDVPNATFIGKELGASREFEGMVLDGEFLATNWNDSQSIVKTQSPHPLAHTLQFYVFDLLTIGEWEQKKCFRELESRKFDLMRRLDNYGPTLVHYVEHTIVETEDEVRAAMNLFCKHGFEGAVLKDPKAPYLFKKTDRWLKAKPFHEGDFTITGVVEGRGKHKGKMGALEIEGYVQWKGKEVRVRSEVGTGFDDCERETVWKSYRANQNFVLGTIVEVEFQEVTEDGKLRFPSFRRFRYDKWLTTE